jgi:hypothetical protein
MADSGNISEGVPFEGVEICCFNLVSQQNTSSICDMGVQFWSASIVAVILLCSQNIGHIS